MACQSGEIGVLTPSLVYVDDTLRMQIPTDTDPFSSSIDYYISSPDRNPPAYLDRVTGIERNRGGFVFWWAPTVEHVGTWNVRFVLSVNGQRTNEQTVRVVVNPSDRTAPVFINDTGGMFRNTPGCRVEVLFRVRDDDTLRMTILPDSTLPDGATLTQIGPKTARFSWVPNGVSQRYWPIAVQAREENSTRQPTRFRYLVVLDPNGPCIQQ